jgi:hypothetical protein
MLLLITLIVYQAHSQHVRMGLSFPVGVSINPVGVAPFAGAIWIGPEWQWRGGNYVHVPGYWAKPLRNRTMWIPGQWKRTRRGFIWVSGRWR